MLCKECGKEIPPKRLEILPHTQTCVNCSGVGRVAGHPIISGKTTYSELQIVSQEAAQDMFDKQNRKGSGVAEGVRFKDLPPPKISNFE